MEIAVVNFIFWASIFVSLKQLLRYRFLTYLKAVNTDSFDKPTEYAFHIMFIGKNSIDLDS